MMLSKIALSVPPIFVSAIFVVLRTAFTPLPVIVFVRFFLTFVKSFLGLTATIATVVLTTFLVRLFAALFRVAFLATPFAAAACPGNHLNFSNVLVRIVARDDDFTRPRFQLGGSVANHYIQARSRVELCRKDIPYQLPVMAFPFESNTGYVQITIARVA